MACGANMTGMSLEQFQQEYVKWGGKITSDGANIGDFIKFMNIQSVSNFGEVINGMQDEAHVIGFYSEKEGMHAVLFTRIKVYQNGNIRVHFMSSQIPGIARYTFKGGIVDWTMGLKL